MARPNVENPTRCLSPIITGAFAPTREMEEIRWCISSSARLRNAATRILYSTADRICAPIGKSAATLSRIICCTNQLRADSSKRRQKSSMQPGSRSRTWKFWPFYPIPELTLAWKRPLCGGMQPEQKSSAARHSSSRFSRACGMTRSRRRSMESLRPAIYNCSMRLNCAGSTCVLLTMCSLGAVAQGPPARPSEAAIILRAARTFDGEAMHEGWAVLVKGDRIEAAGPAASIDVSGAKILDLGAATLMPGLVEGHSHVLLHAYSETSWNDQVAHEGLALRVARATNHLRSTLMAGFTTTRDLGTEGAAYADVELKQAIEQGIIPGPRLLASTRAIVATGTYGPKGYVAEWTVPQGAEEADGIVHLS